MQKNPRRMNWYVPPKQILHSVAEYMKNIRNALRGELVRNKNIVKPHFIGEAKWKKILEQVVIKKKGNVEPWLERTNMHIRYKPLCWKHAIVWGKVVCCLQKQNL